jgi:hypothetical protein
MNQKTGSEDTKVWAIRASRDLEREYDMLTCFRRAVYLKGTERDEMKRALKGFGDPPPPPPQYVRQYVRQDAHNGGFRQLCILCMIIQDIADWIADWKPCTRIVSSDYICSAKDGSGQADPA